MIVFQIHASVADTHTDEFERRFTELFLPTVSRQDGFVEATLLRLYPQQPGNPPHLVEDGYSHQIELRFASENARLAWARSADHDRVWPAIREVARDVRGAGYNRLGGAGGAVSGTT